MKIESSDIYLDYNATTPVDPRVFEAMEPYFKLHFGNPASAGHRWGWSADGAVSKARLQVANLIGAQSSEVYFTSGATESNNWAIFGLISQLRLQNPSAPIHIISSAVEHSSVLRALEAAQKQGVEVDFLPVNSHGEVDADSVASAIKPHTKMISLIWINNEIGAINPIEQIGQIAKKHQILLHSDATQAVGKIPLSLASSGVDLMSFSGHKLYGPKGVGSLFIRSREPKVQIQPLFYGGGQEKGIRSGTLNVTGIVGLGAASLICSESMMAEHERLTSMRNLFWTLLQEKIPGVILNGHPTRRAPNNLNITLPNTKTEKITSQIQSLGVSTGSACGTGSMVISHVLRGIGLSVDQIQRSLRLSLGRWTTEEEIYRAVEVLGSATGKNQSF